METVQLADIDRPGLPPALAARGIAAVPDGASGPAGGLLIGWKTAWAAA